MSKTDPRQKLNPDFIRFSENKTLGDRVLVSGLGNISGNNSFSDNAVDYGGFFNLVMNYGFFGLAAKASTLAREAERRDEELPAIRRRDAQSHVLEETAMNVKEAIEKRRAFRSLDPVEIADELVDELARAASLAPSCFNNQPWRFVFARDPEVLKALHGTLSRGHE